MQLVKKSQTNFGKETDFKQQYTSQNTSRPGNTSRINEQKQKRFKRNKNDKNNHSKSSSNCSQSSSISKFYVKNITGLIPTTNSISNQNSQTINLTRQNQRKQIKSPRQSVGLKNAFNAYGLDNESTSNNKILQKKNDTNIDVSSFLRRQFSPPIANKNDEHINKRKSKGINGIQDSYNFLSPMSKKISPIIQELKTSKDPKNLLQMLTKQRNKNAQINLQLQKCKNNQRKLHLLNQQFELKSKRLTEKIQKLEQDINKSSMNNVKLKQQNHRMKVLVKQRDSLMTTLMEKEKGMSKKPNVQGNGKNSGQNQNLVTKIIEYEYENQKLRDTIHKLKCQIQDQQFSNAKGSNLFISDSPSIMRVKSSSISSQITWDDRQFTDCLQIKQKQILELRQQIKNLQIQINYINRKWANEIQRAKKIQKLEFIKLKDKYKELLTKYKQNMKVNFVLPPDRKQFTRIMKEKKKQNNQYNQNNLQNQSKILVQEHHNPQMLSPRRKKRNYTVDHLKGRGIMSDIRINYGHSSKIGNPYEQTTQMQLQYSQCDDDFGL